MVISVEGIEQVSEDIFDGIIPQRKAFIEWINNNFYRDQMKNYKAYLEKLKKPENNTSNYVFKIYQFFVKRIFIY